MLRFAASAVAIIVAVVATTLEGLAGREQFLLALVLCLFSAIAALMASDRTAGPVIRFAPAFVLTAFVALSPAAGLMAGLAALLMNPGGVAGFSNRHPVNTLVLTTGLLAAYGSACIFAPSGQTGLPFGIGVQAPVLYLILVGTALGIGWSLIGLLERSPLPWDNRYPLHAGFLEMLNIPLAWILSSCLIPVVQTGPLLLTGCLILLGAWTLRKLAVLRSELQSANDSLAARVNELDTLHSIGREIVASLDLQKVYIIVERECRKILDISLFSISLTDPADGILANVYSHTRGEAGACGGAVRWIEKWVAAEKRGMRIGHGRDELARRGLRHAAGAGDFTSTLAVPLIVEDRVVGVLMVQSVLRAAYDEHHLSVLTTVAQQAAVAIENARNYHMATVDSVTGVSLRDYFFKRVEEEHKRASRYHGRFALLMIDLDRFKAINDNHGHQVGDRYLGLLGREIRGLLRSADLACRYGGDEFCILLPETDFEGAWVIAERVRQAIGNLKLPADGAMVSTTASIGMAMFPDHGAGSLSVLLNNADQALYRAKHQGKNQVLPFAPWSGRPVFSRYDPKPRQRTVRYAGRNAR